jgi:pimeloyl-ACP methyl ester carboxylesterase
VITDLSRRFEVDGVSLAWDRWGSDDGVPFLLCHGFSGSTHDFALSIDELAASRPTVAVDHRGHGRSEKVGSADRYSIDRIVADLTALIDAEIGGPVDLLGHSMGGAIALRLTLARPDLVRSLIMMDTSGWSFVPLDAAVAAIMAQFMAEFDPSGGLPDLAAMAGPEEALIAAATPAEWQAIKATMAAGFDAYAFKALGYELFHGDMLQYRPRLGEIACPVSVIVGEHDHPFVDQANELAASVPNGSATVIAGAYHSPQVTHRAEWEAAVQAHLARV